MREENGRKKVVLDVTEDEFAECFKYDINVEADDWFQEHVSRNKEHYYEEEMANALLAFCTVRTVPAEWDITTTTKFNLGEGDGTTILIPLAIPAAVCNMAKLMMAKASTDTENAWATMDYNVVLQQIGRNLVDQGLSSYVNAGTNGKLALMELLIKTLISKK